MKFLGKKGFLRRIGSLNYAYILVIMRRISCVIYARSVGYTNDLLYLATS